MRVPERVMGPPRGGPHRPGKPPFARGGPHPPGKPPFVDQGAHFEKGQPLYIIEVMKMFNTVRATFPIGSCLAKSVYRPAARSVRCGPQAMRVRAA